MSLFNHNNSFYNDDLAVAPGAKDGKIYKIVQLASISTILIAISLVILEAFQLLSVDSTTNGIIISIAVVGFGGLTALPWVRAFEGIKEKQFKITAIAFLALIGVCTLLWVICVWQIIDIYKNAKEGIDETTLKSLLKSLDFIRVSVIVSLQFVIASNITMNIIKYRKTLIPYQAMVGVALLYIDFFLTLVLTAVTITAEDGVGFSQTANFLLDHWQWLSALLVISFVLMIFPMTVFRRIDRRRLLQAKKENLKELVSDDTSAPANDNTDESVEEQLKKLKKLLDKGLINEYEYEEKRADILNRL